MKHIRLITEANEAVGTGHLTRMVALCEGLQACGAKVSLSGQLRGPVWTSRAAERFTIDASDPLSGTFDALVCDSYEATTVHFLSLVDRRVLKVLIHDDATPSAPADLYIEPGVNVVPMRSDPHRRVLAGPDFVLMRDASRRNGNQVPTSRQADRPRVLVSFGGGNGYGLHEQMLEGLGNLDAPMEISYIAPQPLPNVSFAQWLPPTETMRAYYENADVAIVGAGVTAWEALHHGLATGIVCAVGNQEGNYRYMTESGLALGLARTCLGEELDLTELGRLLQDLEAQHRLQVQGWQAVDGEGSIRAARAILDMLAEGETR